MKIKLEKGNIGCPKCYGKRRMPDGSICETCDGCGQIPERRRWICETCGSVHQYKAHQCGRCDSKHILETDVGIFGGVREGDLGWRARRLACLVDRYAMPAEQVVENVKMLAEAGLEEERLTTEIIREANRLDRDLRDRVRSRIERIQALTAPPERIVRHTESITSHGKKSEGKRTKIFGYPATAIVRWMGKRGWNFKQAQKVLGKLGVDIAPNTIKIQLRAGSVGDKSRGEPATLEKSQRIELKKMRND